MKTFLKAIAVAAILLAGYLLLWPVPIDPVAWQPGPNPGATGPFAINEDLSAATLLLEGAGEGPEDITQGPDGYLYTGFQDGRIVRFRRQVRGFEEFANTGGRPLGMQFDAGGRLIVADAFKGLLAISPGGGTEVLVDRIDGKPMLFVDDLDIAADGVVWFSDASQRFDQHNFELDFWEARGTGRLLSYDPATGRTRVHLSGLLFANGVALGPGDEYVLVNETIAARIVRLWLKGPRAGTQDVFLDGLPAYPDNLSFNGRDLFWVALPAPRLDSLEGMAGKPFLRKMVKRLPESLFGLDIQPAAWVIGVNGQGQVVRNLQTRAGGYAMVTSVNEFDGRLYLGSIRMHSVAQMPLAAIP